MADAAEDAAANIYTAANIYNRRKAIRQKKSYRFYVDFIFIRLHIEKIVPRSLVGQIDNCTSKIVFPRLLVYINC